MDWYNTICEITFGWIVGTLCFIGAALVIGWIIDRLREKKERRKILNERYIRYRIERFNREGF